MKKLLLILLFVLLSVNGVYSKGVWKTSKQRFSKQGFTEYTILYNRYKKLDNPLAPYSFIANAFVLDKGNGKVEFLCIYDYVISYNPKSNNVEDKIVSDIKAFDISSLLTGSETDEKDYLKALYRLGSNGCGDYPEYSSSFYGNINSVDRDFARVINETPKAIKKMSYKSNKIGFNQEIKIGTDKFDSVVIGNLVKIDKKGKIVPVLNTNSFMKTKDKSSYIFLPVDARIYLPKNNNIKFAFSMEVSRDSSGGNTNNL